VKQLASGVHDQRQPVAGHTRVAGEYVVPLVIGLASIDGARSVTVRPMDQTWFVLIVLVSGLLALRAVGGHVPKRAGVLVGASTVLVAVYALVSITQVSWSARYFTGDLTLSLLPLFLMLAYASRPGWLASPRGLLLLLLSLLLAGVVAPLFGMLGNRHEAPSTMLVAGCWYLALEGRSKALRSVAWGSVLLVGILTYTSGYRTNLMIWAMAPIVVYGALRGTRAAIRASLVLVLFATVLSMVTDLDTSVMHTLGASRFETLISGRPDESLDTRFLEVSDVIRTMSLEWLPGQHLVGYGYGASYVPDSSFIAANVGPDGRVHNIHVGPALVVFRFGLLGLGLCAAVLALTLLKLRDLGRMSRPATWISRDLVAVSCVALLLFAVESLMLNATVEPSMSWCLAIVLADFAWTREPVPDAAETAPASQVTRRSVVPSSGTALPVRYQGPAQHAGEEDAHRNGAEAHPGDGADGA